MARSIASQNRASILNKDFADGLVARLRRGALAVPIRHATTVSLAVAGGQARDAEGDSTARG